MRVIVYARAERTAHRGSLEEEWQVIVSNLLALNGPDKKSSRRLFRTTSTVLPS